MSVWIPPTYAIIFDFFPINLFYVNLILIFSPARRNFEGDRNSLIICLYICVYMHTHKLPDFRL